MGKQTFTAVKATLLTACLLVASCVAPEAEQSQRRLPTDAEVEQYNASVPPEERIVCRTERGVTSNIPRRVCRYIRDMEETSTFHRTELRRVLQ